MMGTNRATEECFTLQRIFNKYGSGIHRILDVGCGTGLHSNILYNMGCEVTGIDTSKDMIDIAKSKNSDIEFINGDIYSIGSNRKYDSVISMWNVMGYVPYIDDFISKVSDIIKSEGLFIFDVFNGIAVIDTKPQRTIKAKIDNATGDIIKRTGTPYVDLMNQTFTMKYRYDITKTDGRIETFNEEHDMIFYTPNQIKDMLEYDNFELLEMTNVYDCKKATKDDWDVRYIARKE